MQHSFDDTWFETTFQDHVNTGGSSGNWATPAPKLKVVVQLLTRPRIGIYLEHIGSIIRYTACPRNPQVCVVESLSIQSPPHVRLARDLVQFGNGRKERKMAVQTRRCGTFWFGHGTSDIVTLSLASLSQSDSKGTNRVFSRNIISMLPN